MILIDTHSHLFDNAFDQDIEEVKSRAINAGVAKILLPAIDRSSNSALFRLADSDPGYFLPMIGLHPTSVNDNPDFMEELQGIDSYLRNPPVERFYAVGEIGLDLYWSKEHLREQIRAFEFQIELALRYSLPVAVHTREAWPKMTEIISNYKGSGLTGVMHAFSGTIEDYHSVIEAGDFVFGVGGVATYKKNDIAALIPQMDLSRIVLETDSPYLPPVPYRGKRNESSYLPIVCGKIAELTGKSVEEIARVTTENACRIFGIDI